MSSEQLVMNFSSAPPPIEEVKENCHEDKYEALDTQLADLMIEMNGEKNENLKSLTLEVSQHTREGQIAIACTPAQKTELLKTNVVGEAGEYKLLILDNGYLYLRRYWQYQRQLTDLIKSRLDVMPVDDAFKAWSETRLDHYFPSGTNNETNENNWQKVAAERALNNQFLIVSGGPGTGKTTTITRILALLIEQKLELEPELQSSKAGKKLKILLAAPTGKASIKMLDAINEAQAKLDASNEVLEQMPKQASTIHKLLGYMPEKINFKHNRNNPLNADVVLIDEASMIDIALMSKLIEAVPADARLILIGDKDQLSSVETGSVFADLCEGLAQSHNLVTLKKNWRFAEDSAIGQLSIAANSGDSKELLELLQDRTIPDCNLLLPSAITGNQIPNDLTKPWDNYFTVLNNSESSISDLFKAFNEYRILCALRQGSLGSTMMSSQIETALAKQKLIKPQNQQSQQWYHGRPVMITQNSYSKGLFNGDTGITIIKNGETKVYFPDDGDSYKSLAPVRLPAHETTWAMTIHKSQGSEFNQVTLILPHEVMPLITRQLIYTGITRAKEEVTIVASEAVLIAGVKTEMAQATRIGIALTNQ